MAIEEGIYKRSLPVNSLAVINRIIEVLEENKTNSLEAIKDNLIIQELMFLLNTHVFGQLYKIDSFELWDKLREQRLELDY